LIGDRMVDDGIEVTTFEKMPHLSWSDDPGPWLVPARNNIQREMLRLRPVVRYPPLAGRPIWLFRVRRLVLGSCFSLWRSVFQARRFNLEVDMQKDALKFLDELINNNAATYMTELNAWSLEYYIENAVYRIRHAREIAIENGVDEALLPKAHMLGESPRYKDEVLSREQFSPYGEWEECYFATRALITLMSEELRPPATRSSS
jgi:hypothetical protein